MYPKSVDLSKRKLTFLCRNCAGNYFQIHLNHLKIITCLSLSTFLKLSTQLTLKSALARWHSKTTNFMRIGVAEVCLYFAHHFRLWQELR